MRLIAALLIAVPLITGCGKKGPLYLPAPAQPTPTQPSTP
ncbi:MAG: LPS translocon maturation chaperone LptM [Pseudomonadota bacterium]